MVIFFLAIFLGGSVDKMVFQKNSDNKILQYGATALTSAGFMFGIARDDNLKNNESLLISVCTAGFFMGVKWLFSNDTRKSGDADTTPLS